MPIRFFEPTPFLYHVSNLILIISALSLSIALMIVLNRYFGVHVFLALLIAALTASVIIGNSFSESIAIMQSGFGTMLQQIGFVVALGSCLGNVLEKTGAMSVISRQIMRPFNRRGAVAAMTMTGVLVGIPVFCDSGFIILSRLIPALSVQAGVNSAQLSLALSSGLYLSHTLVPPTPGPLAAAVNLGLADNIGPLLLVGILTCIPVGIVSFIFSLRMGNTIIVNDTEEITIKPPTNISSLRAFLPLILPILLIAAGMLPKMINAGTTLNSILTVLGLPAIALSVALLLSMTLIQPHQRTEWHTWISDALKDAGIILLITGAGGSFGAVIKASGIDNYLREYLEGSQSFGVAFLVVGFFLAAVLKTAQGSTTSSMIITSSLLAPLAASAGFDSSLQLSILIVAIGGGAMSVSHANDSYFWVVSQFGKISSRDMFRSFTLITLIQGITALATSIVLFMIL